jgi:hypothetical protein
MRGYSQSIIEANQNAAPGVGVALGALLIAVKYPVTQAAKDLEVSRQTVYDWISGKAKPTSTKNQLISDLIDRLTKEV